MGYQRQHQPKPADGQQRVSPSSANGSVTSMDTLLGLLGSRAGSRQFRAELQSGNPSQPLHQMVRSQAPVSPRLQAKPLFRGISHEWGVAPSVGPVIQPKMVIGEPSDRYEQEADRLAEQVVQQIQSPHVPQSGQGVTLQRKSESLLTGEPASGGMAVSGDLEASIQQARGAGQPLPLPLREPMERSFGADFSGVRIHADTRSDALNRSIQAKAFTTKQDVFFQQGAYQPGNQDGQKLLAHELTHVMQQTGRVANTSRSNPTQTLLITSHCHNQSRVQRLTLDKKSKSHIETAQKRLPEGMQENIKQCYEWAYDLLSFEAFTASEDSFDVYERAKEQGITSQKISEEAERSGTAIVETAKDLLAVETQAKIPSTSQQQGKKKKKKKKNSIEEPVQLPPVSSQRPPTGNTPQALAGIKKNLYPGTFASTMINIQNAGHGQISVGEPILLSGNQGTPSETVEVKVMLLGTNYFFVVHYHPRAEMPQGALAGESALHVKGERDSKTHETITEQALQGIGVPSLQNIKNQFNAS